MVFEDVDALEAALAEESYLADRGLARRVYLALTLGRPLLLEGEPGVGQDRGRQGPRAGARRRADPAPVLRGHRRQPGALRVGLRAPAPLRPRDPGRGARPSRRGRRALRPGVPGRAAAAARGARGGRRGAAGGRARPRRRGVRGLPARGARRLAGDDPRDRHRPRRAAAGGGAHLQPHPRAARRPEAPLPLPLDRLPHARARGRRSSACGRPRRRRRSRGRSPRRWRGCARWTSSSGPAGRGHRLGAGRSRSSAGAVDAGSADETLGWVVKNRDDLTMVRRALPELLEG